MVMTIFADSADAARKKKSRKRHVSHATSTVNNKYAAFVIDASTGQILHQSNADKALYPASLTKIMTLLMVFDALDQGKLSLSERVVMSKRAASMPPSKLGIKPGSSIKVKDAIYALVTKSANDVSAALGEKIAGSESRFGQLMTQKARALGMNNTSFVNASGLHDPRQKSTARDMAILARYVISNYPDYYRYYSTKSFSYNGQNMQNHNHLMKTYKGMDGMKTGYTGQAGFNLVASAVRNNRRVIGVVFGGRSAQSRNSAMASLLDNAFMKLNSQPKMLMASAQTLAPVVANPAETATQVPKLNVAALVPPVPATPAPMPSRKPGNIVVAAAALNKIAPAIGSVKNAMPTLLQPVQEPIGEGDAEDGGDTIQMASLANQPSLENGSWAIQVGAYSSRAATDQALHDSLKKLPAKYNSTNPIIAPMKTANGWLFRARLHGLSRSDAFNACRFLKECVPVAPKNN